MKQKEAEYCSARGEIETLESEPEGRMPAPLKLRSNEVRRSNGSLAQQPTSNEMLLSGARLAHIVPTADGTIKIDFPGNAKGPSLALSTIRLRNLRDKVLIVTLPDGEPVIVGQVYDSISLGEGDDKDTDVVIKGRRVRIETGSDIVLVAGSSRVHLDSRGKLVASADQIVSRARGTNKIQGGNVQIN